VPVRAGRPPGDREPPGRDQGSQAVLLAFLVEDPDDEAAAYALQCVHCGSRGILVTAYGPSSSAEEADVVVALEDARRRPS